MPSISATVTATATRVIKLSPTLKKQLLTKLRTYASLTTQKKALDHAMKGHRTDVESIMEEVGESKLEVEGFKTTLIAPVTKKTDLDLLRRKLLSAGVKLDVVDRAIAAATTETPGTPYVKITAPGDKD